jgi:hypothetical protein
MMLVLEALGLLQQPSAPSFVEHCMSYIVSQEITETRNGVALFTE